MDSTALKNSQRQIGISGSPELRFLTGTPASEKVTFPIRSETPRTKVNRQTFPVRNVVVKLHSDRKLMDLVFIRVVRPRYELLELTEGRCDQQYCPGRARVLNVCASTPASALFVRWPLRRAL